MEHRCRWNTDVVDMIISICFKVYKCNIQLNILEKITIETKQDIFLKIFLVVPYILPNKSLARILLSRPGLNVYETF